MLVEKNISKYIIFSEDPTLAALQKISANKAGFVFSVSAQGRLTGMLTDGDVRRWLTSALDIDLTTPVAQISNVNIQSAPVDAPREEISRLFSKKIKVVPLVDAYGRLVSIAFSNQSELIIGGKAIGPDQPTFIISEIGNNHNGDVELARRLIDLSIDAGVDCVKFQMRDIKTLYRKGSSSRDAAHDLGSEYTLDLLSRFNLSADNLFHLFDYCRSRGIEPLCTPWDETSLASLERYGLTAYKVASADLTNHALLVAMAQTGKPLIMSTGMAIESEIRSSVALLQSHASPYCLLHCNSTYPTPYKDVNLRYIPRLAEIGSCPVGYSGHERGWSIPIGAVALGARVIEKHFTVDRSMEGNDHKVSLLPDEMQAMVTSIRALEESLGVGGSRTISQGEMMNREILAKSLHAVRDIDLGMIITDDMISIQSPGQGLQPNRRSELVGRRSNRSVASGTPFFPSDLEDAPAQARPYHFERPWGVPVRWHDYRMMANATNLRLLEYHLSYKDLEVDLDELFDLELDIDYTVHTPELFSGDHILDLASNDSVYRERSIHELQRVINITRKLKKYHKKATRPRIITNMGGFSTAYTLPKITRHELYQRIEHSLNQIDAEGVEIIPQTMPPFPWHFGGQSYHNIFIDPDEIAEFCERNGMRICFDISHSQLACNHFHWSILEFCEKVGPYTTHLHIVDAKDVDGEGLQIGEGNIDFVAIGQILDRVCPGASFVPEVWQGHKNSGAGFWTALERLEALFHRGGETLMSRGQ